MRPRDLLSFEPLDLVDRVVHSGLSGRGGGGFATGSKWRAVRREGGEPLVVANGAEGEPGSIKDRWVMARRAEEMLLGVAIAARAVAASEAIVFLKGAFAESARTLEAARDELGLALPIRVHRGPDAYVAGEETAILESLEGRVAWPRPKPPYPAAVGYQGRPTLIQNVETLACVPAAAADPDAFRANPRRLVSLWGHVRRPGVHELSGATTVRRAIDELGEGAPDGVAMVFPSGPSAPPLFADELDTQLDPEALAKRGSALGTASLLVVGKSSDPFSVLASLAAFFEREACGQCPPCTVGTASLHRIVQTAAERRARDSTDLRTAAGFMQDHGYCAHCRTAARSVTGLFERARARFSTGAGTRACRPFDPDSPERSAIEAVATGFANAPRART